MAPKFKPDLFCQGLTEASRIRAYPGVDFEFLLDQTELASVLMARLIAARVSFSRYTDRASATKPGPKSPSLSHVRIASSIVHRRAFTAASSSVK